MTAFRSLQTRLALALGVGVSLLWAITAVVTFMILDNEMDEVFDAALAESARRILPLAAMEIFNRETEGISQLVVNLHDDEEYYSYLVRDDQGRVLLRSANAIYEDFPPFENPGFAQTAIHRLYSDAVMQGAITVTVAEPIAHRQEVSRETRWALGFPLLGLIPLSFIGAFLLVRLGLRPARRLRKDVARKGVADLTPIASGDLPSELLPIGEAVNALMSRLERAFAAERSFAANAAHELRTPIAAAIAQVQRLSAETADPATAKRACEIEETLKRLGRISEKLMQLARAEGGRLRLPEVSDLNIVLDMVVADFRRGSDGARIDYRSSGGAILSDLDPDALAILCRNLIENAVLHGDAASKIEVSLAADGRLKVVNDCAPIPAEEFDFLSLRFHRLNTVAKGSGLGLSIVETIARGAGVSLSIRPARLDGSGFLVEVALLGHVKGTSLEPWRQAN